MTTLQITINVLGLFALQLISAALGGFAAINMFIWMYAAGVKKK